MKNILLVIVCLITFNSYSSSYISITDISSTSVSDGINVNIKTFSGTVTGYLSSSYTINGNTIDLSLCYWISNNLLATYLEKDFNIPLTNPGNYIVNVTIHMSTSDVICDDFIIGDNASTNVNYLSTSDFKSNSNNLFSPNPTNGIIESKEKLKINEIKIFDNSGRLMKEYRNIENNKLDLTLLIDGIYFIKIETEDGSSIQKIILKK